MCEVNPRVPQGGVVHRTMPPVDFQPAEVPEACYDPDLTRAEICGLLESAYLASESLKRLLAWLAYRDGKAEPFHGMQAKLQMEILAEIDANTIWHMNQFPPLNQGEVRHLVVDPAA